MAATPITKPIPALKSSTVLGFLNDIQKDQLGFFRRASQEGGEISSARFGPVRAILVSSPELFQSILVEHANDFIRGTQLRQTFRPLAGNGIFTSMGEFHRLQRKLMAPAFQPRHISSYADTMVAYTLRAQSEWADGAVLDIDREMTGLTMSIVGKTLFDADVFTETDELGEAITIAVEDIDHRLTHFLTPPPSWPTKRNRRVSKSVSLVKQRVQAMVDERRTNPNQQERIDLLSMLLNARDEEGQGMSNAQLLDEAITLFLAGHETTAKAVTWSLYLLAKHPDSYAHLQKEVDTILQGHAPTYNDLANLPYALQVLKEAMRLYPPVTALTREAVRDVEVQGYPIAKNQLVLLMIYAAHRRADIFPEPEKFDPVRFEPENEKKLPRQAYMPFGAGPRICIGNYFAMMEGQLILTTLAQQVALELAPGQEVVPDPMFTLRPKNGVRVIVHRRSSSPASKG